MNVRIKTLADLEKFEAGVVARTFERDLKVLLGDLHDRAGLDKVRSLNLKLDLKPLADDAGKLAEVRVDITISITQPASKTRTVSAKVIGSSSIVYDDLSPDNVHQFSIDNEIERKVAND